MVGKLTGHRDSQLTLDGADQIKRDRLRILFFFFNFLSVPAPTNCSERLVDGGLPSTGWIVKAEVGALGTAVSCRRKTTTGNPLGRSGPIHVPRKILHSQDSPGTKFSSPCLSPLYYRIIFSFFCPFYF